MGRGCGGGVGFSKLTEQHSIEDRVAARDKCSLLYWYPKIKGLVPTPRSAAVELPDDWISWLDNGMPPEYGEALGKAVAAIGLTYPIFIRTDQLSGKHSWNRTCFVPRKEELANHTMFLLEENAMQDMFGEARPRAIVVREFLHLKSFFRAYLGMPVAREFRFFATNGVIDCWHPYWPLGSLEEGNPNDPKWRRFLPQLEEAPPAQVFKMVEKVSKAFPEQWSIDVCENTTGKWFVTDMAVGWASFHYSHTVPGGGGREGEPEVEPFSSKSQRVEP